MSRWMTHGRVGKWHVKRVDCKRLSARVPRVWGSAHIKPTTVP
jgi:hypothetical protein